MARRGVPAGWDSPEDRPSILQITVESTSRPRPPVRPVHVLIAIVVLAAIAACVVVAVLPRGGRGSAPPSLTSPPASTPQQPSVLVYSGPPTTSTPRVYRFPVGCSYSRVTAVERNRTGLCTPHDGYVTVVVRRVGTVWRGTLVPIDPPCSQMPMPPVARRKLGPCHR